MLDADERGEEAYVCRRCQDIVTRPRGKVGRKPSLCPVCRG
jgi:rubrerythrin